jgi:radical SAM protein with 4Fe4S-binding SPASM domain
MILQWHIIQRCNVRCKHCYQGEYTDNDPTYYQLIHVLDNFTKFVDDLWPNDEHWVRITGGEPLLHKDWKRLATEVIDRGFVWSLMTNGLLVTPEEAYDIAQLKPIHVQVSIDGAEEIHDNIRGKGNLKKVLKGVKNLRDNDVDVRVSFTANLLNMEEIPKVVQICNDNDVQMFWTDRYIPHSSGVSLGSIGKSELERYLQLIKIERDKFKRNGNLTTVSMGRGLQFLGGGTPYRCIAGGRLLVVLHSGTMMACRRLNNRIGNAYKESIKDVYLNSPLCKSLRDPERLNDQCKSCVHVDKCQGGLKCLARIFTGDPFSGDPACPLLK